MKHIFIGTGPCEHALAAWLHGALSDRGYSPWCAHLDLLPGDFEDEETERVIEGADVLVFLFGPRMVSEEAGTLRDQVERAVAQRPDRARRIFAVCVDGASPADVPLGLARRTPLEVTSADPSPILRVFDLLREQAHPPRRSAEPQGDWLDRLTHGVPFASANSTRQLLRYYLGTPKAPRPFAGRDACLAEFQAAVMGASGPSVVLLGAPTGRGKTAVLCRLVRRLCEQPGVSVAFHAFSLRFDSTEAEAGLAALTRRVLTLTRQPLVEAVGLTARRDAFAHALSRPLPDGGRLVVVIDGVDEADDLPLSPRLLPADLPPSTRVVLSVRTSSALDEAVLLDALQRPAGTTRRIGLERLSLADIDALLARHAASWAAEPDAARRLYALSDEGDPLIFGLLVDEWDTYGPGSAGPSKPGLAGIWHRQLARGERDALDEGGAARAAIAVLALAAGPLSRDELLDLLGDALSGVGALNRALQRVGRLVSGDPGGYFFCHPRLREYVADEELGAAERLAWHDGFIGWSRRALERRVSDPHRRIPRYVLRYAVHHLQRAADADGLTDQRRAVWLRVLEPAWFEAHEAVGGLRGYTRDLDALHRTLLADDQRRLDRGRRPVHLVSLVRCALCLASARHSARISTNVLTMAMEVGLWTPATALDRLRHRAGDVDDGPSGRPDWRAFVARIPDERLLDALDVARERQESGLLDALVERAGIWLPQVGVAGLAHIDDPDRLVSLLLRAARALDGATSAALRETVLDAIVRTGDRVNPPLTRLPWLGELGALGGSEHVHRWAREILAAALAPAASAPDRQRAIAALAHLPDAEARAGLRALVDRLAEDESSTRTAALGAIAAVMPAGVALAVEALRVRGRLGDLTGDLWPRGPRPPSARAGFPGSGDFYRREDERWAQVRAALTADEREALFAAALIACTQAGEAPLFIIRGVARELDPPEVFGLWQRITLPDRRHRAVLDLIDLVDADHRVAMIAEIAEHGASYLLRSALDRLPIPTAPRALAQFARSLSRPYARAELLEWVAAHLPPDERGPALDALDEVTAGLAARRAGGGEELLLGAALLRAELCPSVAAVQALQPLVEATGCLTSWVWPRVQRQFEALPEPLRAERLEWLFAEAATWSGLLLDPLFPPAGSAVPDGLRRRLADGLIERARGPHRGRFSAPGEALRAAVAEPDPEHRRARVAQAIELSGAIDDALARLGARLQLVDTFDSVEADVQAHMQAGDPSRRGAVWDALPEGWFEAFPRYALARAEQATRGAGALPWYGFDLDPRRWIAAVEQHAPDALDACFSEMRARLDAIHAAHGDRVEGLRSVDPAGWQRLPAADEEGAREWLWALACALPAMGADEAGQWVGRIPLWTPWTDGQPRLLRDLIERLPPPERVRWLDEAWSYGRSLGAIVCGEYLSAFVHLLPAERRPAAVDEVLSHLGRFSPEPGQTRHNGWDILEDVASWLRIEHVPGVLDALEGIQKESPRRFGSIVGGARPAVRQALAAALLERATVWSPDERRALRVVLVALEGLEPADIADWREMADPRATPDPVILDRLSERLSARELAAYVDGWLCAERLGRVGLDAIARLVPVLAVRGVDRDGLRGRIYGPVLQALRTSVGGRPDLVERLARLRPLLRLLGQGSAGDLLAEAIREVGDRWP